MTDPLRLRAEHCADHPVHTVSRTARYILTGEEGAPLDAPGYERIAEAIANCLDTADLEVEVCRVDGDPIRPHPLLALARVLDKGGLIDWAAFLADDTGRTP